MSLLPPAIEISRLQRMKEAVLGEQPKRCSFIGATDDWIAETDARLAALERAVFPSFRNTSNASPRRPPRSARLDGDALGVTI